MSSKSKKKQENIELIIFSLILVGTYLTSFYSFLLFHTIAELFSIIVAEGIFVICWNSRENIDNSFFLVVGISLLYVGFIDLIHTLAYTGMNIFIGYDSNLPTSLWIAARYLQAISFLYASLVFNKEVKINYLLIGYTLITFILIYSIFAGFFPVCYIEGSGLTPFKIISEYIIIFILIITILVMRKFRSELNKKIYIFIIGSLITTIIGEFVFTLYVSVYGFSNLLGHIFKIIAFFFLYKAIIVIGLENPYNLLFRKLKKSEEKYFNLFEASPVGIGIADMQGNMISINKKFQEIIGYSLEELKNINRSMIYDDPKERKRLLENLFKTSKVNNFEVILKRKNSESFFALMNAELIDIGGQKVIIKNIQDISDKKEFELALAESEEKFRTIAEQSSLGIVILQDGLVKYSNKALSEITGYSKEEISEWSQMEFSKKIHPDDLPVVIEEYKKKMEGYKDLLSNYTCRIITKSDDIKWIEIRSKAIQYLGRIADFATFIDITEQREAERRIREAELRYRTTFEQSPDGIMILDPLSRRAVEFNDPMCKLLGYTHEEFARLQINEYDAQEAPEETKKHIETILKEGRDDFETKFRTKSGEIKDVYVSAKVIELSGNIYFQSICRDITERKKIEEKIADLAKFPSENPMPVLRVNNETIIYCNKIGEDLFNISKGSPLPILLKDDIMEVLSNKKLKTIEKEIKNKFYSFVITPVEGVNYINIYGMDITERILAEKRLEHLISTVSHELRTPITVILMSLDYLKNHKENITPELEQRLMDGISRNTFLLHKLAEDILMVSRIDEHRLDIDMVEYSPLEIVNEILTLMEQKGKEKGIIFEILINENIQLFGDPKRIDQIFRILIDNAIKYSEVDSKIEISAINNYKGKYNPNGIRGVLFQFKDYGIGISEKDIPHLFERFFRSEQVKEISGTGLGLSIARELTQLHNGEIFVESEFRKGSNFYVFLPRIEG
ncbi:MAG: MASE3 domain-containing protein [Promethearchaeota archaeon]